VTLYAATGDQAMKRLRHPDVWTAVVRACPRHAHWLDGEPITGIEAMGGVADRLRRLTVDGRPAATGLALLADSAACTNPSLGRGIALGLAHAQRLRDTVREHGGDPRTFSAAWRAATEDDLARWYRATVAFDRARLAEVEAERQGRPPEPARDPASAVRAALPLAMAVDADVFRAGLEIIGCLSLPEEVFARPGLAQRVLELAGAVNGDVPRWGPDRSELLELVAA
jgi:hypothetical protein